MEDTFEFICPTKLYYRPEGVSEIGRIIKEDYRLFRERWNLYKKEWHL